MFETYKISKDFFACFNLIAKRKLSSLKLQIVPKYCTTKNEEKNKYC